MLRTIAHALALCSQWEAGWAGLAQVGMGFVISEFVNIFARRTNGEVFTDKGSRQACGQTKWRSAAGDRLAYSTFNTDLMTDWCTGVRINVSSKSLRGVKGITSAVVTSRGASAGDCYCRLKKHVTYRKHRRTESRILLLLPATSAAPTCMMGETSPMRCVNTRVYLPEFASLPVCSSKRSFSSGESDPMCECSSIWRHQPNLQFMYHLKLPVSTIVLGQLSFRCCTPLSLPLSLQLRLQTVLSSLSDLFQTSCLVPLIKHYRCGKVHRE